MLLLWNPRTHPVVRPLSLALCEEGPPLLERLLRPLSPLGSSRRLLLRRSHLWCDPTLLLKRSAAKLRLVFGLTQLGDDDDNYQRHPDKVNHLISSPDESFVVPRAMEPRISVSDWMLRML